MHINLFSLSRHFNPFSLSRLGSYVTNPCFNPFSEIHFNIVAFDIVDHGTRRDRLLKPDLDLIDWHEISCSCACLVRRDENGLEGVANLAINSQADWTVIVYDMERSRRDTGRLGGLHDACRVKSARFVERDILDVRMVLYERPNLDNRKSA